MTVSSTVRRAGPFLGDGTQTVFPFPFKTLNPEDLLVIASLGASELGVDVVELENNTDYTVSLNQDQENAPGGSITLNNPLATGHKLAIISDRAYLQDVDLTNLGGFYPQVINIGFDNVVIQTQQLAEEMERAIKVPVTDGRTGDEYWKEAMEFIEDAKETTGENAERAEDAADRAEAAQKDIHENWQEKLDAAHESATAAIDAADRAEDSADRAEAAAQSVELGGEVYPDEPTGRAAVADGEYFRVIGSGDVAFYVYRRIDANSSQLVATIASKQYLDGMRELIHKEPDRAYLFVIRDGDDRVAHTIDANAVHEVSAMRVLGTGNDPLRFAAGNLDVSQDGEQIGVGDSNITTAGDEQFSLTINDGPGAVALGVSKSGVVHAANLNAAGSEFTQETVNGYALTVSDSRGVMALGITDEGTSVVESLEAGGLRFGLSNDSEFKFSCTDKNDIVPFGIRPDGTVFAGQLETTGSTVTEIVDDEFAFAVCDEFGRVGYGVRWDGTVFDSRTDPTPPEPTADKQALPTLSYVDASNNLKTVNADGSENTVADLSAYGSNIASLPHVNGSKSYITVLNRPGLGASGVSAISLQNAQDGSTLMLNPDEKICYVIPCIGQSNSVGSRGVPVDIASLQVKDFAGTLKRPGNTQGYGVRLTYGAQIYDKSWMQELVPLNPTEYGGLGVTHLDGLGFRLAHEFRNRLGFDPYMVLFTAGQGGKLYTELMKGTSAYNNLIKAVERIKELVAADGYKVLIPFISIVHGESDANHKEYKQGILDWQSDLEADLKPITGQAAPMPAICSQASTFGKLDPDRQILGSIPDNPSAMGRVIWGVYPTYLACRTRTTHHMAGSYYTLPFSDDYLHLSNYGHALNGEYQALTAMATIFGNKSFGAIMPRTVTFNGTDTVDISFDVPVLPLVRDPTISDPGSWGFELFDGDGWSMTNVDHHPGVTVTPSITGPDSIRLVCSEAIPAGPQRSVGYALQGWAAPKQPGQGSRGQIRDSSTDRSIITGAPLYRWMPHFLELF